MADSQIQPDPLEQLAEDFVAKCRRGESPSVSEFANRHTQHAERIRALFPAIAMMEGLRTAEHVEHEQAYRRSASHGVPSDLGDFQIICEIGRGGMGIVFEALQRSLDRRVAVKVLPNHALLREKDLRRFRREAQTAARLHHTNIVPVYGVGDHHGVHYYVMPLIRGVGLDEIIRHLRRMARRGQSLYCAQAGFGSLVRRLFARRGEEAISATHLSDLGSDDGNASPSASSPRSDSTTGLDRVSGAARLRRCGRRTGRRQRVRTSSVLTCDHWRTVARVGIQAARALSYAHTHGTLHRDIKPGNLLVDTEGNVSVADFGLARAMDRTDASHSGDALGTLRYMAPEQRKGRAEARSDLYSLGVTLYELATLRSAFAARRRRASATRDHADRALIAPAKTAPGIPRDLETVILKCLAYRPEDRYATAGELAADLQRFLDDRPIHARRVSLVERTARWTRRNPALAGMSALAMVLLIAVSLTAAIGLSRTRAAHVKTAAALTRAEQHSELALDVLEDIYQQISPDRFGICPGGHAEGERSTHAVADPQGATQSSVSLGVRQIPPSPETALLLENLLRFYDRLAEQAGDDQHVLLDSAIASRRVGDIRRRLGQLELAERAYRRAIDKLQTIPAADALALQVAVELARDHNELGNVQLARQDASAAYSFHEQARRLLQRRASAGHTSDASQYELARTLYLLTNTMPGQRSELHARTSATEPIAAPAGGHRRSDYRHQASCILAELVQRYPREPDYRFLLALSRRPLRAVTLNSRSAAARRETIEILRQLVAEYPEVADYRYELATTYACVHVGLYPWQTRSSAARDLQPALCQAWNELQWLVERYPSIPEYAHARAVVQAKLGTLFWACGRLSDAAASFRQAFQTQAELLDAFPELPSHQVVFREFLRLRTAQVDRKLADDARTGCQNDSLGQRLDICIAKLTELIQQPELAEDRLARLALREACRERGTVDD